MTTNRIEVLDPALIRPGRVDVMCYFGLATKEQIQNLFIRFFPKEDEKTVSTFVEQDVNL